VVDQRGRLLSEAGGPDADRLELQGRMEDKLRAQVDGLLAPMLGQGNYTSEVQVELDMDQVTSARESYDKNGVVRSETSAQSQQPGGQPGQAGGIPGALSNTPPPPTTAKQGPPLGGQPSPAPSASAAAPGGESSATRTYELGREVSVSNAAPGKIKRLSVAVAISQEAMKKAKPADLDQIKALVSAAVGLDPQRGDQVQVITRAFEPVEDVSLPFYEAPWFAMVVRSVVALLAVLLVLLMGVRPLVRALKRGGGEGGDGDGGAAPARAPAAQSADPALLGRQVGLAQRIVEEKPEDALVALRSLLGQNAAEPSA
jgi:flagellar M-ring protein FliF